MAVSIGTITTPALLVDETLLRFVALDLSLFTSRDANQRSLCFGG